MVVDCVPMISSRIHKTLRLMLLCALSLGVGSAQILTMVSGNGQVVPTQWLSNNPMVVQANDASGHPLPNVPITWAITQGSGTLNQAIPATDANGQASVKFLSSSLQLGVSFEPATITASSPFGIVTFYVTTVISIALQPAVSIQLLSPTLDNPTLTGASGTTIPGAVVVQVVAAGGAQSGLPIPNVGIQIVNGTDVSQPAPAACAGQTGIALTNSSGNATCDLVVSGAPQTIDLRAWVGGVQYTRAFSLTITPGQSCHFSLSATSQSVGANGGTGSVNVITTSGCGWSAASNASFIAITSATTGTGNGTVSYAVAANSGAARTGFLTIAGQTYTINQAAAGGSSGSLTIPAQTLPVASVGTSYHASLTATGGTPPYTWSPVGPISTSGLSLRASGDIYGAPSNPGTYSFVATVLDNVGASQARSFSITVQSGSPPTSGFNITNTSFPNGAVGQSYPPQLLGALGGCVTPFSPQPSFAVSQGALPDGLSIQTNSDGTHSITGTPTTPGPSSFTLEATDACGKTATASFSITITGSAAPQQMLVGPASLAFTVQYGADNAAADQALTINATSGTLSYSVAVASSGGGNWLVAKSPASGTTPGSFTVGITNFSSLAPGNYAASVTFSSQATNSPVVVQVMLTVLPSAPLAVTPSSVVVNQTAGNTAATQQDIKLTSGSNSVQFTAIATTNKGGQWLTTNTAQGNTPATVRAIINPAGLAAGQYTGTITILPSTGVAQTVAITLNIVAAATLSAAPAPVVFSYQQGSNVPEAQSLAVSSSGSPLTVSAAATTVSGGNWLQVSPANGTTALNLTVSVTPVGMAAGTYTGTITITSLDSTVTPINVPVTLTVAAAAPLLNSVTNAASFAPGPVAPGELVTIFGSGLGPSTLAKLQLTDSGTVDTTLGGTQVFFDGYAAPLIYSSFGAVAAIVPYEIGGSPTTSMLIVYQGTRSNTVTLPVLDSLPGIFTADASGYGQGAIVNQDGSINSNQNGADPGSVVSIYATGAGQTNPPAVDGSLATAAAPTVLPVTVQIAGESATVLYAGAAPGEPAGVIQVNARIPADVPRGSSVPVAITVGTVSSQAGVTLAIKQ